MKNLFLLLFLFISTFCFSQEDDSLRVSVSHNVIDPTLTNPKTTVETYIEIGDSIDLFLDNFQKQFGSIEEENGVFVWQGILIDSVGANLRFVMYNGVWSMKNDK